MVFYIMNKFFKNDMWADIIFSVLLRISAIVILTAVLLILNKNTNIADHIESVYLFIRNNILCFSAIIASSVFIIIPALYKNNNKISWNKKNILLYCTDAFLLSSAVTFILGQLQSPFPFLADYSILAGILFIPVGTVIYKLYKETKPNNTDMTKDGNSDLLLDNPIKDINRLKILGREDFFKGFIALIDETGTFKNNIKIVLNGTWGSGKTSILNCIQKGLDGKNPGHYTVVNVNPWFNDTKEKFVQLILDNINEFTQNNRPYKSIDKQIQNILNICSITLPYLGINFSDRHEEKDIVKITENISAMTFPHI